MKVVSCSFSSKLHSTLKTKSLCKACALGSSGRRMKSRKPERQFFSIAETFRCRTACTCRLMQCAANCLAFDGYVLTRPTGQAVLKFSMKIATES